MASLDQNANLQKTLAIVAPGDVLADKYRIDAVLGVGGMGVVFAATHLVLGTSAAIKFLSPDCLSSPQALTRFNREAKAAANIRNEHVVSVFDVGTHPSGLPYMVMEYLKGGDLARLLSCSGPLPVEQATGLLIQACFALSPAHQRRIVHRDLKPSNLFCVSRDDGSLSIKVVDFGISKVLSDPSAFEQGTTVPGIVVGSPSYMSPEQIRSPNLVDHRTDIWSLGVVLYESLTCCLPFTGRSYGDLCLKINNDPPTPLRSQAANLPSRLEAVILKCLEKDPEKRYSSVAELAAALAEFAPAPARHLAEQLTQAQRLDKNSASLSRFGGSNSAELGTLSFSRRSWTQTARFLGAGKRPLLAGLSVLTSLVGLGWLLYGSSYRFQTDVSPATRPPAIEAAARLSAKPEAASAPSPLATAQSAATARSLTPEATAARGASPPRSKTLDAARGRQAAPAPAAAPRPLLGGTTTPSKAPAAVSSTSIKKAPSLPSARALPVERDPKSTTWDR